MYFIFNSIAGQLSFANVHKFLNQAESELLLETKSKFNIVVKFYTATKIFLLEMCTFFNELSHYLF